MLGQVSTDMNEVVCDHPESNPALDAGLSFIERSPQPVAAFEDADAALAAGTPLLKVLRAC